MRLSTCYPINARLIAAVIITFASAARIFAVEPEKLDDRIRGRAEKTVKKAGVLGLAIGVVEGEQTHLVFAGRATIDGAAPDEKTVFEIGSITKAFTGLLLADAVQRGEVKLDQPVAELLGPDAVVPKFEDQPIRLVDLATQTSGLPRLPTNMGFLVNPLNPYANYEVDDLLAFLAKHKLKRRPADEYEYSNLGMGLLGTALGKRADKSYEELIVQRISKPLGMNDTTITLSDDQQSRLATGVSSLGLPATTWDFPSLAGCGGIRSTLHDMVLFLRANLSPEKTPLAKAIALSHHPRFTIRPATDEVPESLAIGLGWHITTHKGTKIVWHNGMTGGYASFMALVPAKQWGIVVLGNTASAEIDKLGNGLLLERIQRK